MKSLPCAVSGRRRMVGASGRRVEYSAGGALVAGGRTLPLSSSPKNRDRKTVELFIRGALIEAKNGLNRSNGVRTYKIKSGRNSFDFQACERLIWSQIHRFKLNSFEVS
jgi:hypothetical protein